MKLLLSWLGMLITGGLVVLAILWSGYFLYLLLQRLGVKEEDAGSWLGFYTYAMLLISIIYFITQ